MLEIIHRIEIHRDTHLDIVDENRSGTAVRIAENPCRLINYCHLGVAGKIRIELHCAVANRPHPVDVFHDCRIIKNIGSRVQTEPCKPHLFDKNPAEFPTQSRHQRLINIFAAPVMLAFPDMGTGIGIVPVEFVVFAESFATDRLGKRCANDRPVIIKCTADTEINLVRCGNAVKLLIIVPRRSISPGKSFVCSGIFDNFHKVQQHIRCPLPVKFHIVRNFPPFCGVVDIAVFIGCAQHIASRISGGKIHRFILPRFSQSGSIVTVFYFEKLPEFADGVGIKVGKVFPGDPLCRPPPVDLITDDPVCPLFFFDVFDVIPNSFRSFIPEFVAEK